MTTEGAAMTPLSDSEAATVARFENTEPAPESWGGGDGLLLPVGTAVLRAMLTSREEPNSGSLAAEIADAVLALPEIAALRAKADAADRVRAALESPCASWYEVVKQARRALDGDQP